MRKIIIGLLLIAVSSFGYAQSVPPKAPQKGVQSGGKLVVPAAERDTDAEFRVWSLKQIIPNIPEDQCKKLYDLCLKLSTDRDKLPFKELSEDDQMEFLIETRRLRDSLFGTVLSKPHMKLYLDDADSQHYIYSGYLKKKNKQKSKKL